MPEGQFIVYIAGQNTSETGEAVTRVGAYYRGRLSPPRGAKIRFSAFYANGRRADLINAPGPKDDAVALHISLATARLRNNGGGGPVTIKAELIDAKNRVLARSDTNAMNFVAPTAAS